MKCRKLLPLFCSRNKATITIFPPESRLCKNPKPQEMKTPIPLILALFCAVISLNSCVTGNSATQSKSDVENAKDLNSSCYVVMSDGSIRHYSSLKLVTGLFVTPHLLADKKLAIDAKDITAYQDNRRYAVSQKLLTTKKTSYVALETLPGFAVRVVKGKLNVYARKYYNGNTSVAEYFLQHGDDGEIVAYSTRVLSEMVKDNQKASEYFNSKIKVSPMSKKILATADIYNNSELLSKN